MPLPVSCPSLLRHPAPPESPEAAGGAGGGEKGSEPPLPVPPQTRRSPHEPSAAWRLRAAPPRCQPPVSVSPLHAVQHPAPLPDIPVLCWRCFNKLCAVATGRVKLLCPQKVARTPLPIQLRKMGRDKVALASSQQSSGWSGFLEIARSVPAAQAGSPGSGEHIRAGLECRPSLGLSQCSATLHGKKFFLVLRWNFCFCLRPSLLVLSPKSPELHTPFAPRRLKTPLDKNPVPLLSGHSPGTEMEEDPPRGSSSEHGMQEGSRHAGTRGGRGGRGTAHPPSATAGAGARGGRSTWHPPTPPAGALLPQRHLKIKV